MPLLRRTCAIAAAACLLPLSTLAQCPSADVSGQFAGGAARDQCDIGSCHVFGTIGLLEAAIARQHKKRVRLSEADLFAARIGAADEGYYDSIMTRKEGGFVEEDLRFALANGVAYARDGDYDEAAGRYDATPPRENRAKANQRFVALSRFMPRRLALKLALLHQRRLDEKSPMSPADMERDILGGEEAVLRARKERAEVKAFFSGFTVEPKNFRGSTADGLECRKGGAEAVGAASFYLCHQPQGIPVAVSMRLDGLPDWGNLQGNHAFILSGLKTSPGRLVFESRNSWGGKNPVVRDFEACRINAIYAVVTPSDVVSPAPVSPFGPDAAAGSRLDEKLKGIARGLPQQ